MNYAIILAAGNSKRLKLEKPKQFTKILNDSTILELAIKNFFIPQIDFILIVANKKYLKETKNIIKKLNKNNIEICLGGSTRNISLKNGIKWLKNNKNLNDNDVIITHDSARIFLNKKIILNNISLTKKHGACTTVVNCKDTISQIDKKEITKVLNRKNCLIQQTPQCFNWKNAQKAFLNSDNKLLNKYTDACGLLKHYKIKIYTTKGDYQNFKITDYNDLLFAKYLLS
ncbi:IspD/TarI family cytidylyltransferase [Mycoplasmoides pirum]|uniref:IspD/TarI family cytidylyltransferase n=1 Tax=Mycoplasmoides pirum TaxID=2122 RepID=UPI000481AD94|nr:IspD/TarI family cytidylyltransferase [Mycoplasmoides pirum]